MPDHLYRGREYRQPSRDRERPPERPSYWEPMLAQRPGAAGPEAARRPQRRAHRRRRSQPWWLIPIVLAVLALIFLGSMYGAERRFRGHIYPSVYVAGVDIGGMTPEEAEAALRKRFEGFQEQPLVLLYAGRAWYPRGDEIGVEVAWSQAVADAMAVGREGAIVGRWWQRREVLASRHDLLLPLFLDEELLRIYLEDMALSLDTSPLDAALAVEGKEVRIRPSHEGRSLQIVPSLLAIKEALGRLAAEPVPLVVDVIPPTIDDQAVTGAAETARQMLAAPLVIHAGGRTWTLTPEKIGAMLKVERRKEGERETLTAVLDQESLYRFMAGIAGEVLTYPRNAHFRFVGDHLEITDEGAPGWELPLAAAVDQVNAAILSTNREVDLSLAQVLPPIRPDTIDELGIREMVAVGESHFAGSMPYRVHNIVTGAHILDGTLIAPGETFSFLKAIGPIDESQGFVEGYSIIAERTVRNVGGGICQVSTTVFRAGLLAGLPILERHPHAYRLAFYEQGSPVGLDATIFVSTGTDLQFRNDTSGYLLMQFEVYTDSGTLLVYLYGTKPKREVRLSDPELSDWVDAPTQPVCVENPALEEGAVHQTDWAVDGVTVRVYRTIVVNGTIVSQYTIESPYEAWPNILEKKRCP